MRGAHTIGMLAGGLAIAAALGAASGTASADSTDVDSSALDPSAFDPSALIADSTPADAGLNLSISIDGYTLVQDGDAYAFSGTDDMAIAYGESAVAQAGDTANPGIFDSAFASGSNADAISGVGDGNSATAFGSDSYAAACAGSGDTSFVDGTDTTAIAGGVYEPGTVNTLVTAGNDNFAAAIGNYDLAEAEAVINGSGVTSAGDIATIVGNSSDAYAGLGDYDWAGVFGDGATSTATVGNFLAELMPSLF